MRVNETWAFTAGDGMPPEDCETLSRILAVFGAALNSIDNTNFANNAGIQISKLDNDFPLDGHSWTHHAGYSTYDELDDDSVSGSMIAANAIGPWHIGLGAIIKKHFGDFDPLSRCFYVDSAPLSGTDGTFVPFPAGFDPEDGAKMVLLPAGAMIRSSAADTSVNATSLSFTPAGQGVTIRAKASREDENESCPISVYYFRMAWK